MKIAIDTDTQTLSVDEGTSSRELALYSGKAFEILSDLWVKVGWQEKYTYTFSWMGRPIIQLPEDMMRIQEVIWQLRPDVIVETGVAHGGSLIFYASLCHALGSGRIIGVDIEIRPHNRSAIETHPLAHYIRLVEGNSTEDHVVETVRAQIRSTDRVLVILDSNHSKEHVRAELEAYAPLVTIGSYVVATDGIMATLSDVPRGRPEWVDGNPMKAAEEFAAVHPEFVQEPPAWTFNESQLARGVTHWPGAWLRRH